MEQSNLFRESGAERIVQAAIVNGAEKGCSLAHLMAAIAVDHAELVELQVPAHMTKLFLAPRTKFFHGPWRGRSICGEV